MLSSMIFSSHIQMFAAHPADMLSLQEEHVRSPGMPISAGPLDTDLRRHSLQYVRMLPL